MTRIRLLIPLLTLLAALVPVAAASAAAPGVNVSYVSNNGDPYVVHPGNLPGEPSDAARAWQDLVDSGARQVRTFVQWSALADARRQIELDKFRQFTDKANARGLSVMLTLTGDANTMATPAAYARVAGDLASHLRGKVAAYEVWNEPDETIFWRSGPQPAAYAALLKAAYPAFKAADPAARVFVGGLVANDFEFVEALYGNGAKGSFDGVGIHTDTACLTTDPREYYREPDGRIGRYSFTGYREVRRTMLEHGDDKPIWMSELGWSSNTRMCAAGARAGTKPEGVTRAEQADFLAKAYGCMANDPYLQHANWFNLHDITDEDGLGLIKRDFTRKPAFAALQRAAAAGPIPCGGTIDSDAPHVRFAKPTDGAQYLSSLPIDIRATDDKGVKDIDLFVDGKEIGPGGTTFSGSSARATKEWTMARNLAYGPHTLVARARDEAKNVSTARVTVVHVGGGAYKVDIRTKVRLKVSPIAGGRVKVRGKVVPSVDVGNVLGMVSLYFERYDGKRWVRFGLYRKNASRPFRVTHRVAKGGRWRVRARYTPKSGLTGVRASRARAPLSF